jgi:hypothetical protein
MSYTGMSLAEEGQPNHPTITSSINSSPRITTPDTTTVTPEPCLIGTADCPSRAPKPSDVLRELQEAANDIAQLAGRFGPKMLSILRRSDVKKLLFMDRYYLRLPSLLCADEFSCSQTDAHAKQAQRQFDVAPLLWWLYDALLILLAPPLIRKESLLTFTSNRATDIDLPYTFEIDLKHRQGGPGIALTAHYRHRRFEGKHMFWADITEFWFPVTKRYGKLIPSIPLAVDAQPYGGSGSVADIFDYLLPRPESIWRLAMESFPSNEDEKLTIALVQACKAPDDRWYMSEDQDRQCHNLLQRFPKDARRYIAEEGLVGKERQCYSKAAFNPGWGRD